MFDMRDVIEIAIQLEKNGGEAYQKAADSVSDPAVARLFRELAEDETRHEQWFARLRDQVEKGLAVSSETEKMGMDLLKGVVGDQTFSLQTTDLSGIETTRVALKVAEEFEKDTILFYEMILSFVTKTQTLQGLTGIIEEEKKHVHLLQERRKDLAT